MDEKKYTNTTDHSVTIDAAGRQIGGGEFVITDEPNPQIRRAVENGTIVETEVDENERNSERHILLASQREEAEKASVEKAEENTQNSGMDTAGDTSKKSTSKKKETN